MMPVTECRGRGGCALHDRGLLGGGELDHREGGEGGAAQPNNALMQTLPILKETA